MIERAPSAEVIAAHFDALLGTAGMPDYPNAVNGLQVANRGGPITRIAAAVEAAHSMASQPDVSSLVAARLLSAAGLDTEAAASAS